MIPIYEKYKQLKSAEFVAEQTRVGKEATHNVLFISPQLNDGGLYKMILPAMMLEHIDGWKTAMTGMARANKDIQEIDIAINTKQILWADVFVFPFTSQALYTVFNEIRMIKKGQGKECNILYCVDFNPYVVSNFHDKYNYLSDIKNIESNIINADRTLVTNGSLAELLNTKMAAQSEVFGISFLPQLCVPELMTPKLQQKKEENKKEWRVGVICSENDFEDLNSNKKLFAEINKKYGDKVKLIFFGFDGRLPHKNKYALDGISHTYIAPLDIIPHNERSLNQYHLQKLESLKLDIGWIMKKDTVFNTTSTDFAQYIDFTMCGVPVMSSNVAPYNQLIKNEVNGLLYEKKDDIFTVLDKVVSGDPKLKRCVEGAVHCVNQFFSYTENTYKKIANIYL